MNGRKIQGWVVITLAMGFVLGNAARAPGQRGMGDWEGVAREGADVQMLELRGTVEKVVTEPCRQTTGRSLVGTHLLLAVGDGETWNVHLGPAAAVEPIARKVSPGMEVTVEGFRTERMPEDACVACSLMLGDQRLLLRDESLRPVWAGVGRATVDGDGRGPRGGGWNAPGSRGRGWGRGGAWGGGRGNGWGRGRGWGY